MNGNKFNLLEHPPRAKSTKNWSHNSSATSGEVAAAFNLEWTVSGLLPCVSGPRCGSSAEALQRRRNVIAGWKAP